MLLGLKKIVSPFVGILPLSLLMILFGSTLVARKKQTGGLVIIITGLAVVYFFSLFPVAALLLRPLQKHYSRYQPARSPASYVVVLGGWHKSNKRVPLSSQLSKDSLMRTVEAIIIYRQNPGSKLVLSGGEPKNDPVSNARMMAKLAVHLGVPWRDIILEERSKNTEDEARYIKHIVNAQCFVLVTSASHMLRAVELFKKQGLFPIPAPVNFLILNKIPLSLFPSVVALQSSEKSLHEYFGIIWAWLNRQI